MKEEQVTCFINAKPSEGTKEKKKKIKVKKPQSVRGVR